MNDHILNFMIIFKVKISNNKIKLFSFPLSKYELSGLKICDFVLEDFFNSILSLFENKLDSDLAK